MGLDYGAVRNRYSGYEKNVIDDGNGYTMGKQALFLGDDKESRPKFWKPEAGTRLVDILPYKVTTDNHPSGTPKGGIDYVLEMWVHKNVGPNKDTFICLEKHNKGRCPICDDAREQFNALFEEKKREMSDERKAFGEAKKELRDLEPKRRVVYNLVDLENPEEGVLLYEAPWFWFEKPLVEHFLNKQKLAKTRGKEFPEFWRHDAGSSVSLNCTQEKFAGREFVKSTPMGFEDRDEQYDDSVIDMTYSLDSFLVIPTAAEVKEAYMGFSSEEDSYVEEPSKEEPAPAPKTKSLPKAAPKAEEKKEMTREERLAMVQAKKAKEASGGDCPSGYTFGDDYLAYDECVDCPKTAECEQACGI